MLTQNEKFLIKEMAGRLVANPPIMSYLLNLDEEIRNDFIGSCNKALHEAKSFLKSPGVKRKKVKHATFCKDFPVFSCDYDDYFPKS